MSVTITPPTSPKVRIAPRAFAQSSEQFDLKRPEPIKIPGEKIEDDEEGKELSSIFQDDQELTPEQLGQEAINTGNIKKINVKNSKPVISYIHKKRIEAAKVNMFELAQKCDDAVRAIMQKVAEIELAKYETERFNDLDSKLTVAQNEYDMLKGRWDTVIGHAEQHKKEELDYLQSEMNADLEELDKSYDGDPPISFRKLSPRIIEMRDTIRKTAKAGNLQEADRLKQLCDEMEEQEKEEHRKEWRALFHVTRDERVKSWNQKYELKVEQLDRDIAKMKRYKTAELVRQQRVIDHIKDKLSLFTDEYGPSSPRTPNPRMAQTARTPRLPFTKTRSSATFVLRKGVISKPATPRTQRNRTLMSPK